MEITRRFITFLEKLQDPQEQDKFLNPELEECLQTIVSLINKVNFSDAKKLPSINE